MEEIMMMISSSCSSESPRNRSISDEPITTSTCPTWKLYENPFYYSQSPQYHKQLHRLHLPISARKIAASFWDLTFIRPFMDSELDIARAQIIELKAELEFERKARKKMESTNKKLTREVSEERRGREALERVCEELAKEISSDKAEINRMKREMAEERKMLRMAEVLREECVQMKLTEAKLLLEEKILELEVTKQTEIENHIDTDNVKPMPIVSPACNSDNNVIVHSLSSVQRRASPEPENPHIRRGIKGFVEFPKVVRAIGSKSRHLGTKLECQKAQLRILLKQKCSIRSNNLIIS
uniref:Branchless trichome n=1 Tax=Davidia involucrata TaxID=16924 RepID=A0A5B7BN91_DAVIN